MCRKTAFFWAATIMGVAFLNIIDVLPDSATYAAVLTLPALAVTSCRKARA